MGGLNRLNTGNVQRLSYSVSVSGMGAMRQRVNGDCSQRSHILPDHRGKTPHLVHVLGMHRQCMHASVSSRAGPRKR